MNRYYGTGSLFEKLVLKRYFASMTQLRSICYDNAGNLSSLGKPFTSCIHALIADRQPSFRHNPPQLKEQYFEIKTMVRTVLHPEAWPSALAPSAVYCKCL
jgi:hypothetical protein